MKYFEQVKPLLKLIRDKESLDDYVVVWGRIARKDQPPKPLTSMSIGEVLLWQNSIDRLYMSEAAGAYQILEDTLRGLYASAGLTLNDKFDAANQDRLGYALLQRRGLHDFMEGKTDVRHFGNSLAKEWASFPVLNRQQGSHRTVERGQSYYAGDKLNKAHASPEEVEAVLARCRKGPAKIEAPLVPMWAPERLPFWAIGLLFIVIMAVIILS